jgi:nitrate/nitrite-specific signal transduction histidine kinase
MAHRAAKLGGALRVESAPGKGTSVIFAGALPAVVQRVSEDVR